TKEDLLICKGNIRATGHYFQVGVDHSADLFLGDQSRCRTRRKNLGRYSPDFFIDLFKRDQLRTLKSIPFFVEIKLPDFLKAETVLPDESAFPVYYSYNLCTHL